MPESVTDRPTKSHEYVFLLTKSRNYFFDADAVREESQANEESRRRAEYGRYDAEQGKLKGNGDYKPDYLNTNDGYYKPGRNKRTVWTITTKPYPGAHFACVDTETECLTKQGWMNYERLNKGMEIAGYELDTGLLRWQKLNDISAYDVIDEEMVSVETRDMSMLLTWNHRCVVRRRTKEEPITEDAIVIRAHELNTRSYIPISADWAEPSCGGVYMQPEFAELMGWFVTDGYIKHSKFVGIDQSWAVNKEKCNRIRYLLEYLQADYKHKITKREWGGRPADMMHITIRGEVAERLLALCPNKKVPFGMLTWQEGSMKSFLNGVIGGDGSLRKDDGRISIIQKNKAFLDDIQAIAVRLGNTANLSQRKDGTWVLYLTGRKYRGLRGTNGKNNVIGRKKYTGVVWCPQTELTTFVARRNGKVFITGNTFPPELPEICIKAGTSEKGVCPVCGAGWVRVVERTSNPSGKKKDWSEFWPKDGDKPARTGNPIQDPSPGAPTVKTLGWKPSCEHNEESVSAIVLDVFAGSGTTIMVANALGRRGIGIDLSWDYLQLARERTGEKALREWQDGKQVEATWEDTPLFKDLQNS
jgi:hypothetical protein